MLATTTRTEITRRNAIAGAVALLAMPSIGATLNATRYPAHIFRDGPLKGVVVPGCLFEILNESPRRFQWQPLTRIRTFDDDGNVFYSEPMKADEYRECQSMRPHPLPR